MDGRILGICWDFWLLVCNFFFSVVKSLDLVFDLFVFIGVLVLLLVESFCVSYLIYLSFSIFIVNY